MRVQIDPDLPGCIALEQTASIERLSAFQEGLLHIQDKSSQLCAAALGAKTGRAGAGLLCRARLQILHCRRMDGR